MKKQYLKFEKEMETLYNDLLTKSFSKNYWVDGEYQGERIKWTDIDQVKAELNEFNKSGVYIWGHGENPICIGKTVKQSFKKDLAGIFLALILNVN